MSNSLDVVGPTIRPASVEPPRTNYGKLKEPDDRREFGAYWKKAHLILRAIPQVEPRRTNYGNLKEPDDRHEFGAYWKKAHLKLRAIPQVKGKDYGIPHLLN